VALAPTASDPRLPALERVHLLLERAEAVEDSTRIELQRFSTQRETQSASVPLDQVDRQRFAERFDLKADRRLAGAQFGGRLRQAPARATPRNERSWR
jgi:hypothetical protein